MLVVDVSTLEERVKDSISFLEENDYVVLSRQVIEGSSVRTIKDLVEFFYARLQYKNPNRVLHYTFSNKRDRVFASKFINGRMQFGVNRYRALKECVAIIKCVVDFELQFKFSCPVSSLEVFGQDTMKWVSDKAVSIINSEDRAMNELIEETQDELLYEMHEREALDDLENKIEYLDKVRKDLKDAQEKENTS